MARGAHLQKLDNLLEVQKKQLDAIEPHWNKGLKLISTEFNRFVLYTHTFSIHAHALNFHRDSSKVQLLSFSLKTNSRILSVLCIFRTKLCMLHKQETEYLEAARLALERRYDEITTEAVLECRSIREDIELEVQCFSVYLFISYSVLIRHATVLPM